MIQLEKVSQQYGAYYAIKNFTLTVQTAETIAIIGPSGSGKSTLLRCINHLQQPTSGQILINGQKITRHNWQKLCLKVGMVFQSFNLFPHMSVEDNLTYSPINVLGLDRSFCRDQARNLLNTFNLAPKITAWPADLSGGEKQRVAIARALMMNPQAMLFDEPTSALDPEFIKDVIEIILSLKAKMTMIIVTHQIKFAQAVADRIIFMEGGIIVANQTTHQFFQRPESARAKLFLENIGDFA